MDIFSNKLHQARQGTSPNISGALLNPTLLVLHYTASGGTGAADAAYLSKAAAKASAHIVIGRGGASDLHQIVPFNRKAWHAGKSVWRGRSNCNDFSIGIEIDNWGFIRKLAKGAFTPAANPKLVIDTASVVEAAHKNPAVREKYWEIYPKEQIDCLIEVIEAILAAYPSIKEIVGHEDIAPGRKTDPGPALPWSRILNETIGRKDDDEMRRVNTPGLNVRGGPGTNFDIIDRLDQGTHVELVYDVPGAWAQIRYQSAEKRHLVDGFVAERYLSLIG